jgi:hypothetical protein
VALLPLLAEGAVEQQLHPLRGRAGVALQRRVGLAEKGRERREVALPRRFQEGIGGLPGGLRGAAGRARGCLEGRI